MNTYHLKMIAKNCLNNSEVIEDQYDKTYLDKIDVLQSIFPEKDLSPEVLESYQLGYFEEDTAYDFDRIINDLLSQEEREIFASKVGHPLSFYKGDSEILPVDEVLAPEGDFYKYVGTAESRFFKVKRDQPVNSGYSLEVFKIPAGSYVSERYSIDLEDGERIWLNRYRFITNDLLYIREIKSPEDIQHDKQLDDIREMIKRPRRSTDESQS